MSENPQEPANLTHFAADGSAHMVDVGDKSSTKRIAVATGIVRMQPETAALIRDGRAGKGDVLGVARVAGIMATKRTSDLIPLCHPLPVTHVEIGLEVGEDNVSIRAQVETRGQTGVEMEALTAVSVTALTIYDMVKAVDRGIEIDEVRLALKDGGKSGRWERTDG